MTRTKIPAAPAPAPAPAPAAPAKGWGADVEHFIEKLLAKHPGVSVTIDVQVNIGGRPAAGGGVPTDPDGLTYAPQVNASTQRESFTCDAAPTWLFVGVPRTQSALDIAAFFAQAVLVRQSQSSASFCIPWANVPGAWTTAQLTNGAQTQIVNVSALCVDVYYLVPGDTVSWPTGGLGPLVVTWIRPA
jgi:hypothetical protein